MATADPPDTSASPLEWERPLLYTQIDMGSDRTLHIINVHLKSKLASTIPGQKLDNFTWRTVSAWAEEVSLKAICGPVEETGNPAHAPRVIIPCENNIPDSSRYSLFHLGKGQMLDHTLVSPQLLRYFRGAEIDNDALPDESGAFRQDTKSPESDHAPLVAAFDLN